MRAEVVADDGAVRTVSESAAVMAPNDGSPKEAENQKSDEQEESGEHVEGAKSSSFIRHLCILPPLQRNKRGTNAQKKFPTPPCGLTMEEFRDAVKLPPIRPEEPVASIRAALSEVRGFAHMTAYRLVVENHPPEHVAALEDQLEQAEVEAAAAAAASVTEAKPDFSSPQSRSSRRNKKKRTKAAAKGGAASVAELVSPYTSKDALIMLPWGVHSLDRDPCVVHSSEEAALRRGVLDDYGDLRGLLPPAADLQPSSEADPPIANGSDHEIDQGHLRDGSGFRVVLERYDPASVRDHVSRLKSIFDGNIPYITSLVDGAADADGDVSADPSNGDHVLSTEHSSFSANPAETDSTSSNKENHADFKPPKDKDKVENTKSGDSKDASDLDRKRREGGRSFLQTSSSSRLPDFPLEQTVAVDGTNLSDFYYLACGEEEALALRRGNKSQTISSVEEKKKTVDTSVEDLDKSNGVSTATSDDVLATLGVESDFTCETARVLNELEDRCKVKCMVRFGGFHPPPPHRRIRGDLAYLEVNTPDSTEGIIHITAVPTGFYVNRTVGTSPLFINNSSDEQKEPIRFDPNPADEPCYSHELLDCILLRSKSLRLAWADALAASKERSQLSASASASDSPLQAIFRVAVRDDVGEKTDSSSELVSSHSGVDAVVFKPSWLVPLPAVSHHAKGASESVPSFHCDKIHEYNPARSEDDLTSTFGLDIRGGAARDWNEELQNARELPMGTLQERVDRARVIHKVLSDFGEASLVGAKAILDGHVTAMNPNEPTRSHVFLHNNIFFSRAVDAGVDTFKIAQGDKAGRKSATRDAECMGALHRLDISGLHTLATVLVDYLGTRLVCQSIVPGILHGERTHTVLYGAVEAASPLSWDEEMHNLLEESLGKGMMVATRPVPTFPLSEERMEAIQKQRSVLLDRVDKGTKQKEIPPPTRMVCGPIEAKGIKGSDQRKYILDLTRLTPRDANWVPKDNGGTGHWEDLLAPLPQDAGYNRVVPRSLEDDEFTMAVLRSELVTSFTRKKMSQWIVEGKLTSVPAKANEAQSGAGGSVEETTTTNDDQGDDVASHRTGSKVENDSVAKSEEEDTDAAAASEEKPVESVTSADSAENVLENIRPEHEQKLQSLRMNVNVFLPGTKSLQTLDQEGFEQMMKDEEYVREVSSYLWNKVLPMITKEVRENSGHQLPMDGISLTEFLHNRGINCRYLGRLALLAQQEEEVDKRTEETSKSMKQGGGLRRNMPLCWLELLECEMVARAAKHVLDSYLTERGGIAAFHATETIATVLSALLSTSDASGATPDNDGPHTDVNNPLSDIFSAGNEGDAGKPPLRSRKQVWDDIEKEIGRRFRYVLTLYNADDENRSRALYFPLLRRICQRSGVRIAARAYDAGESCSFVCVRGRDGLLDNISPVAPSDILEVLPLMKHSAAQQGTGFLPCVAGPAPGAQSLHILLPDAKAAYESAHIHWNARALPQALDLVQEAASLYQRVVDTPLHLSVAKCIDLTSVILFHAGEHDLAAANSARALALAVQLGGFDCFESVTAHTTFSHILVSAGALSSGLKHLRACLYLMELMAGPRYAEIANIYHKIGSLYHEVDRGIDALRFYQEASVRLTSDKLMEGMISKSMAVVLASMGHFKAALIAEKKAYGIYTAALGEAHELTKNSENSLKQFTALAVQQRKNMVQEDKRRREEEAAAAMATEIEASEREAEEKRRNKYGGGKKNKKKT